MRRGNGKRKWNDERERGRGRLRGRGMGRIRCGRGGGQGMDLFVVDCYVQGGAVILAGSNFRLKCL
jgi:hypothetical protein